METSNQIAWKIVPIRNFFPLKVVPLIEVLLYRKSFAVKYPTREPPISEGFLMRQLVWLLFNRFPVSTGSR
jgi:hypothetical protein